MHENCRQLPSSLSVTSLDQDLLINNKANQGENVIKAKIVLTKAKLRSLQALRALEVVTGGPDRWRPRSCGQVSYQDQSQTLTMQFKCQVSYYQNQSLQCNPSQTVTMQSKSDCNNAI